MDGTGPSDRSAEEGPSGAPFAYTGAVWFPGSRPRGGDWKTVCLIPIRSWADEAAKAMC